MGKLLDFVKLLDCLSLSADQCSCFGMCAKENHDDDEYEFDKKPLMASSDQKAQLPKLKDFVSENQTLAFQLKPKVVVLRVSMHCYGCAKKAEKHISRLEVSCQQSASASGKNGHPEDNSGNPQPIQESLNPISKRENNQASSSKKKKKQKKKNPSSSKTKTAKVLKTSKQANKKNESQNQFGEKQIRKNVNPIGTNLESSNSWVCKNAACQATVSTDDSFCKRCSCCVCHLFDDNKDPSLWLVCASEESDEGDYCGLSCHIECALKKRKVGVVDLGQQIWLDGSYCCAACGKVFGILGCWKKQLLAAKDARRLDVLCYRIYLSYRLFDGTTRFKELHRIVKTVKSKLENEVGPLDRNSVNMAWVLVNRLSIASDVQNLCLQAIEKADEWLANASTVNQVGKDSLPAACRFQFEEVTASSLIIHIVGFPSSTSNDVKGFKLWFFRSIEEAPEKDPVCTFLRSQKRILISNLEPCTEYTFRIISYMEGSDLGRSEAKCFTKSLEIFLSNPSLTDYKKENNSHIKDRSVGEDGSSRFKVRELGKFLQLARDQGGRCFKGSEKLPCGSDELDLNVVSVPDLNEGFIPHDSSGGEDKRVPLGREIEPEGAAAPKGKEKNVLERSNRCGGSPGIGEDAEAVDLLTSLCRKRKANRSEEPNEWDSGLVKGSPTELDENFEECVKIIRLLECNGLIDEEFRLKFLTWFSLRSTVQERRVVSAFIHTLIGDLGSLAAQLVDTFSGIVLNRKPRNGSSGKP